MPVETQLTLKQKQMKHQQKANKQRELTKKLDNDSETGDDEEDWETADEDESCSLGSEDTEEFSDDSTNDSEDTEDTIEDTRITKDDEKALKNIAKLHDVISEIFPSKFMDERLQKDKKMKKNLDILSGERQRMKKKSKYDNYDKNDKYKKTKHSRRFNRADSDEDDDEDEDEDEDDEDDDDEDDDDDDEDDDDEDEDDDDYTPTKKDKRGNKNSKGNSKGKGKDKNKDKDLNKKGLDQSTENSILMLFGGGNRDDYISEFEEDSEDEKKSNPDEEERVFAKDLVPPKNAIKHYSDFVTPPCGGVVSTSTEPTQPTQPTAIVALSSLEQEYMELLELRHEFREKMERKPTNTVVKRALRDVESKIRKLVKRGRKENTKKFYRLIHADTRKKGEIHYFENNLSHKEQKFIIEQMHKIESQTRVDKPYRITMLQSDIPENFKAIAMNKLNALASMDPIDSEYYKLKSWVDNFMKIPFGIYRQLPVRIDDGPEKCQTFMEDAVKRLDECVYGMKDVKVQVLQLIGQWISNPSSMGQAIALQGPPGTGKTSIIKDGISKIMGRDFAFIPLGGCGDSSFLEGHSYTYEGSTYGHILQNLIQKKSMNLVFYFDELDKVSDTARGQEIIGILTHLTDSTQNNQYHDKYFSEIDFDLSKCIFLFSYNDETMVNPILRDRFKKIRTQGYSAKEKVVIARDYLIPKICQEFGIAAGNIVIPDDVLQNIIENYTCKEEGVRNLKRCLETIYSKVNLLRLMRPGGAVNTFLSFGKEFAFPFTVSRDDVDKFIKMENGALSASQAMMYV